MMFRSVILYFFFSLLAIDAISQKESPDNWCSPDSLKAIVRAISHDSMQGRFTGSKGFHDAARFITKEFKNAGLKPLSGNDGFVAHVPSNWSNIVGGIQGSAKPNEVVIFSAHYDHIGTQSTNPYQALDEYDVGDTIYNGADDNGSGIAALICLARYFAKQKLNQRTILFVAFGGEELGMLGSNYFAMDVDPDSVIAVINIDMIGRKDFSGFYLTGANYSNLFDLMGQRLSGSTSETFKKNFIRRENSPEKLFQRSDNYPFAKLGIPAHTVITSLPTFPTDRYYHTVADEFNSLDYSLMSKVVKAIAIGSMGLVTGEDTPTRIDKKTFE